MGPSPLAAVGSPWWKAVGRPGDGFSRFIATNRAWKQSVAAGG